MKTKPTIQLEKLRKRIKETERVVTKLKKERDKLLDKNKLNYCEACNKYYAWDKCKSKITYWDPDGFSAPEQALYCPKKHTIEEY